ncbi:MAG: hypothetical protein OEV40_27055, partial [Acidimicrobiia bacterium]|nr:hypothetical protein [Acidimicrobiia bacterium]
PMASSAAVHVGAADEVVDYGEWLPTFSRTPADNAPGLPETVPFWLFVNNGVLTELAPYERTIDWARSPAAWPELTPGCCDQGDVAPLSPDDPWPADGWPADGFYSVVVDAESDRGYDLSIRKWVSCRDDPGICPDWWDGDEVTTAPDQPPLHRQLPFDPAATIVLMPMHTDSPIVAHGPAFRELLANPGPTMKTPEGYDQAHPAPGGGFLATPSAWWHTLEIRDAKPVLYIHAGLIAG